MINTFFASIDIHRYLSSMIKALNIVPVNDGLNANGGIQNTYGIQNFTWNMINAYLAAIGFLGGHDRNPLTNIHRFPWEVWSTLT